VLGEDLDISQNGLGSEKAQETSFHSGGSTTTSKNQRQKKKMRTENKRGNLTEKKD